MVLTANICYCELAWSHKARLLCFLCDTLTLRDNGRQVRLHYPCHKRPFLHVVIVCMCEFANLLSCIILIAAKDWKKNQCICYCLVSGYQSCTVCLDLGLTLLNSLGSRYLITVSYMPRSFMSNCTRLDSPDWSCS